jgi:hypothetical protein
VRCRNKVSWIRRGNDSLNGMELTIFDLSLVLVIRKRFIPIHSQNNAKS